MTGHWRDQEEVLAFIGGTLETPEKEHRLEHLAGCDSCREQLLGVQERLKRASEDAPRELPDAAARSAELRRRLDAEELGEAAPEEPREEPRPVSRPAKERKSWFTWPRLVPALAASMGLIAFVVWGLRGPGDAELVAQVFEEHNVTEREVGGLRGYSPAAQDGALTRGSESPDAESARRAEEALRAADMSVERLNALGYLRLITGQPELAEESYAGALRLAPESLEAVLGRVVARLDAPASEPGRRSDLEWARGELEPVLDRVGDEHPGLEPALYTYALILHRLGLGREAEQALRRYQGLNPPEDWAARLRARLSGP